MRRLAVKYRPEADRAILDVAAYVLDRTKNLGTAHAYVRRLHARCNRIGNVPFGGTRRDDLGPGIRMTVFERRVVILYRVDDDTVWITNIFSGGRDYDTLFDRRGDTPPDEPG